MRITHGVSDSIAKNHDIAGRGGIIITNTKRTILKNARRKRTKKGSIDSWLEWTELEVETRKGKALNALLKEVLEPHFEKEGSNFIVGNKVSLADITLVCSLQPHFQGSFCFFCLVYGLYAFLRLLCRIVALTVVAR